MPDAAITVFGSPRSPEGSPQYEVARELGKSLAAAGFAVVTGGHSGVMEAVSRGASEAGGHVIGVLAHTLTRTPNKWLKETIVVSSWQERLCQLAELGSGYVVMNGGTGTLVELALVWEMIAKQVIGQRPLVALGEYWRPIVQHLTSTEEGRNSEGFIHFASSVPEVLKALGDPHKLAQRS